MSPRAVRALYLIHPLCVFAIGGQDAFWDSLFKSLRSVGGMFLEVIFSFTLELIVNWAYITGWIKVSLNPLLSLWLHVMDLSVIEVVELGM